jgi:hypothetical protein
MTEDERYESLRHCKYDYFVDYRTFEQLLFSSNEVFFRKTYLLKGICFIKRHDYLELAI